MKNIENEFLNMLKYEKNYSENTIKGYSENLSVFNEFLQNNKIKNYNNCDYDVIRKFIKYLYELNYSNKSICRYISCLRSFFKYLSLNEFIDINPMILISNPKLEKKLPKFLYYEDLEKILSAPDINNFIGLRDALILELLYSTGIRVSELVNITLKDISYSERKIKILGKGNKERYTLYGKKCEELLNKYIDSSRKKLLKQNNDYLILSNTGKQINVRQIRNIINNYTKKSGVNLKISPHTFRHTYATHMLNDGADLRSVQELLGHENLSTTTIYTHLSNERLRNVYLNSHPRAHKED